MGSDKTLCGYPFVEVAISEYELYGRILALKAQIKRLQAVVKAYCDFPSEEQEINLNARVQCDEMDYDLLRGVMDDAIAQLQDGDLE